MKFKQFAMLLVMAVCVFAFSSCGDDEKDVELSADLSGKWTYSIPEEKWEITYQFNSDKSLIVTEYEDGYVEHGEGSWDINKNILTLAISWNGDSSYDYENYRIVSRTTKTMELYDIYFEEYLILKKK